MTGCGSDNSTASNDDTTGNAGSANQEQLNTNEDALNICLLLTGNLGDMSFLDSSNAGLLEIQKQFGADIKVIEMGNDDSKYQSNLLDASDEGYDIIICSGFRMQESIEEVAPNYSDIKYIIFDGAVSYSDDNAYENVYSMTYRANQSSFLAGALAALMTETNYIGFLGGQAGAGIDDFAIGYIEGAQYINEDIKVTVGYVDDFIDTTKCKEMALAQYNQGVDIIFTAAGGAGLGTLDAAKDMGKLAIGVDSDQALIYSETDPEKANLIPTSVMKKVDVSLIRAIELEIQGNLPWGTIEALGLEDDAVSLSENSFYEELVSEEIRATIDEVAEKIIAGEIVVTSAYDLDNAQTQAIFDSAK